jgi:hypothetical protein
MEARSSFQQIDGRSISRFDTFVDEQLWTDTLRMQDAISNASRGPLYRGVRDGDHHQSGQWDQKSCRSEGRKLAFTSPTSSSGFKAPSVLFRSEFGFDPADTRTRCSASPTTITMRPQSRMRSCTGEHAPNWRKSTPLWGYRSSCLTRKTGRWSARLMRQSTSVTPTGSPTIKASPFANLAKPSDSKVFLAKRELFHSGMRGRTPH